ncbi:chascon isoform d-related [Anaeramoeba flamelloides]|uniref:Chascon isoform d-related n=1 Tax=Anaeramoeba flamelloides TaxID=1746091 RepID=A0AAV7ZUK7_9EUKA|nr:chascon isoform d-related [Anaeramoeba flamelloides]
MSLKEDKLHVIAWMRDVLNQQIPLKSTNEEFLDFSCQTMSIIKTSYEPKSESDFKIKLEGLIEASKEYGINEKYLIPIKKKFTKARLITLMKGLGICSEQKEEIIIKFSEVTPIKLKTKKRRNRNLVSKSLVVGKPAVLMPMKRSDRRRHDSLTRSPFVTLKNEPDEGFTISSASFYEQTEEIQRIQQLFTNKECEFVLIYFRKKAQLKTTLQFTVTNFIINIENKKKFSFPFQNIQESKVRFSSKDNTLFQLVLIQKIPEEGTNNENKEENNENKEENEKANKIKMRKKTFKFQAVSKIARHIFSKAFQMYLHYHGDHPESIPLIGEILGYRNEEVALSLRCLANESATFQVRLLNQNSQKVVPIIFQIEKEYFLFQPIKKNSNYTNETPYTFYWEDQQCQTAVSNKSTKGLEIIIGEEISTIKVMRIQCYNNKQRDLIQRCFENFQLNYKENIQKNKIKLDKVNEEEDDDDDEEEYKYEQKEQEKEQEKEKEKEREKEKQKENEKQKEKEKENKIEIEIEKEKKEKEDEKKIERKREKMHQVKKENSKQSTYFAIFNNEGISPIIHLQSKLPFLYETCIKSPLLEYPGFKIDRHRWLQKKIHDSSKKEIINFNIDLIFYTENNIGSKVKLNPPTERKRQRQSQRQTILIEFNKSEIIIKNKERSFLKRQYCNKQKFFAHAEKLNLMIFIDKENNKYILETENCLIRDLIMNIYFYKRKIFLNKVNIEQTDKNMNQNKKRGKISNTSRKPNTRRKANTKSARKANFNSKSTSTSTNTSTSKIKSKTRMKSKIDHKHKTLKQIDDNITIITSQNLNGNYFNINKQINSTFRFKTSKLNRDKQLINEYDIQLYNSLEESIGNAKLLLYKKHFILNFFSKFKQRYYSPYSKIYFYNKEKNILRFHLDEFEYINISFDNQLIRQNFINKFKKLTKLLNNSNIFSSPIVFKPLLLKNNGQTFFIRIILHHDCFILKSDLQNLRFEYSFMAKVSISNNDKDLARIHFGTSHSPIKLLFQNSITCKQFRNAFNINRSRWVTTSLQKSYYSFNVEDQKKSTPLQLLLSNNQLIVICNNNNNHHNNNLGKSDHKENNVITDKNNTIPSEIGYYSTINSRILHDTTKKKNSVRIFLNNLTKFEFKFKNKIEMNKFIKIYRKLLFILPNPKSILNTISLSSKYFNSQFFSFNINVFNLKSPKNILYQGILRIYSQKIFISLENGRNINDSIENIKINFYNKTTTKNGNLDNNNDDMNTNMDVNDNNGNLFNEIFSIELKKDIYLINFCNSKHYEYFIYLFACLKKKFQTNYLNLNTEFLIQKIVSKNDPKLLLNDQDKKQENKKEQISIQLNKDNFLIIFHNKSILNSYANLRVIQNKHKSKSNIVHIIHGQKIKLIITLSSEQSAIRFIKMFTFFEEKFSLKKDRNFRAMDLLIDEIKTFSNIQKPENGNQDNYKIQYLNKKYEFIQNGWIVIHHQTNQLLLFNSPTASVSHNKGTERNGEKYISFNILNRIYLNRKVKNPLIVRLLPYDMNFYIKFNSKNDSLEFNTLLNKIFYHYRNQLINYTRKDLNSINFINNDSNNFETKNPKRRTKSARFNKNQFRNQTIKHKHKSQKY